MSKLERLLYTSKATEPMGTLALFNLLNSARKRNSEVGITGHLLYVDGTFAQCIEGPPDSIEKLWQSIQHDNRHIDVELVRRTPIDKRRYPEWKMAFSSYRYLNTLSMPGFFPIDQPGADDLMQLTKNNTTTSR